MFWRTCILVALGIINVILLYRMVWGDNGVLAFNKLRNQYSSLVQELATIDEENINLSNEIRLLKSDEAYIEKMIRQRLHYVRDNEILYLFTETPPSSKSGEVKNEGKN